VGRSVQNCGQHHLSMRTLIPMRHMATDSPTHPPLKCFRAWVTEWSSLSHSHLTHTFFITLSLTGVLDIRGPSSDVHS
jgi:hypothetical protein